MPGEPDPLVEEIKRHPEHRVMVIWHTMTDQPIKECRVFCETCQKDIYGFAVTPPSTK